MNKAIEDKIDSLVSRLERLQNYHDDMSTRDPFIQEELELIKVGFNKVKEMNIDREKSISDIESIIKNLNG